MPIRPRRGATAGVVLVALAMPVAPALADSAHERYASTAASTERAERSAAERSAAVRPGKYTGNRMRDGKPSKKQYLRFRVTKNRKYVTNYTSRVWVICFAYPLTYTHYPVKFTAPRARIRNGKIDRTWKAKYVHKDEEYTFEGRLKLNLRKPTVRGKVSISFASCQTKLGEGPHWVPLRAKHK